MKFQDRVAVIFVGVLTPVFVGALNSDTGQGNREPIAVVSSDTRTSAFVPASSLTPTSFVASAKGRLDIEGGVVRLAARRDGVIDQVLVEEGERVKAGQVLASLDTTLARRNLDLTHSEMQQAQRQVESARIRFNAAEREIARLEPLRQADIVARREMDRARDELDLARAELELLRAGAETALKRVRIAEREIEERLIRAPLDGQILQRQSRPGNGVSTLNVTPLFLFAPDVPRIIRADLEERFLGAVAPGQNAEVVLEANPEQRFQAQVLRLGKIVGPRLPSDDPSERQDIRAVECVLSIDAPGLLIGQRVIVRFAPRH